MTARPGLRDLLAIVAVLAGAAAQKLFYKGVERGLIALALVGVILAVADRLADALALERGRARPAWLVAHCVAGLAAVLVYPLPDLAWQVVLGLGLGALAIDVARGRETTVAWGVAGLALSFALATHAVSAQGPPNYDSALYLLDGRWLIQGLAPYRDFYLNKSPGLLVPNALFALAGDPYVTPQVISFLCVVATGAILAREVEGSSRALALAGACALASLHGYRGGGNFPETYALPCLALAWARLSRDAPSRGDLVVGGVALAALGCFKQTHAIYTIVGLGLVLARDRRAFAAPLACAATVALVFGPLLLWAGAGPVLEGTLLHWLRPRATVAQHGTLGERIVTVVLAPAWPLFLASLGCATTLGPRHIKSPRVAGFIAMIVVSWFLQLLEQRTFANPHYVLHALVPLALVPWACERLGLARNWTVVLFAAGLAWSVVPEARDLPHALERARAHKARVQELGHAVDRSPLAPAAPLLVLGWSPDVYLETSRSCAAPLAMNGIAVAQVVERGEDGRTAIRDVFRRKRPVVLLGPEDQNELVILDKVWPGWRDELLQGYDRETVGRVSILRPR